MIAVNCTRCGRELDEPGGLLISPPQKGMVFKHHLCVLCYRVVANLLGDFGDLLEAT